jgi:hypothetical protein
VVGAAITAIGLLGLYRNKGSSQWPAVAGTVVDVEIETRHPDLDSSAGTFRYFAILHYQYAIGGRPYRGTRNLGGIGLTSRADAVELGRRYTPGQRIEVFVDQRNPQRHTLFPAEHRLSWLLVAVGLAWLGLALKLTLE